MCNVCGCGVAEARIEGSEPAHHHRADPGGAHAPDPGRVRTLRIEQDILARNDAYAAANRRRLAGRGIFALNLVSSPGSGKTTLLVRTIERLAGAGEVSVIEGDQQTSMDAERIRAAGARAVQINTGRGCHLDAHMVGHAIESLRPADGSVLLIENVGNLVCPAAFDLGEAHKVVVLSVTEGEDKPLKYPDMFRAASLMLLSKADLLPHLSYDAESTIANAHRVNPRLRVIRISAHTGEGFDAWIEWLGHGALRARDRAEGAAEAPRARVAQPEPGRAAAPR